MSFTKFCQKIWWFVWGNPYRPKAPPYYAAYSDTVAKVQKPSVPPLQALGELIHAIMVFEENNGNTPVNYQRREVSKSQRYSVANSEGPYLEGFPMMLSHEFYHNGIKLGFIIHDVGRFVVYHNDQDELMILPRHSRQSVDLQKLQAFVLSSRGFNLV